MTPTQFTALAHLAKMQSGPAQETARLHFVEGMPVPDAARQAGCSYQAGWQAVKRAQVALDLARAVLG